MNEKIILILLIILASITPIHAVQWDADSLQELHELEDKMSREMYGMSFDELQAESNSSFTSIQDNNLYAQRINNIELAVQNYLMLQWGMKRHEI